MRSEVFQAASTGDLRFFKKLNDPNHSTLHEVTPQGNTILHVALQFKKIEAVEKIVELCPSLVSKANSKGNTPLHVAAMVGDSSMVKLLIDQAKELDGEAGLLSMANQDGDTALHVAVRYGNNKIDVVEEQNKHSPSQKKNVVEEQNKHSPPPKKKRGDNDKGNVVEELIKYPELTKLVNKAGESALFLAVDMEHYKVARILTTASDDCSYAGRHGMNVLHALVFRTSSCKNTAGTIESLKKEFTKVNVKSYAHGFVGSGVRAMLLSPPTDIVTRDRALTRGLRTHGNIPVDLVKKVMERWPTAVEEKDDSGWTPLHIAAHMGNMEFVKLLLEKGNSPAYERNNEGLSAQHIAAKEHMGNKEFVKPPLEKGNSPAYVRNKEGLSALHIAAKEGYDEVMKELMKTCPDMYELLDNKGRNALHAAAESGMSVTVEFFLRPEFEGLLNEQDKEGNTPMHLAAINGHYEIASQFARWKGVHSHLYAMNKEGFTTMDIVLLRKDSQHTSQLWKEGARPSVRGEQLMIATPNLYQRAEPGKNKISISEAEDNGISESGQSKPQEINSKISIDTDHQKEKDPIDTDLKKILDQIQRFLRKEKDTDHQIEKLCETNFLVATLIATVSFTAAFTVPGGYNQNGNLDAGLAVLCEKAAFAVFLIANTLAFGLSITSTLVHFYAKAAVGYSDHRYHNRLERRALLFTFWSTGALMLAFISGTYTVVHHSLGISVAVIVCCCIICSPYFDFPFLPEDGETI